MPDARGALSPERIKAKEEALAAFYRHRSESLRGSNTAVGPGTAGQPALSPKPAPTKARRPGLFGYIADVMDSAVGP